MNITMGTICDMLLTAGLNIDIPQAVIDFMGEHEYATCTIWKHPHDAFLEALVDVNNVPHGQRKRPRLLCFSAPPLRLADPEYRQAEGLLSMAAENLQTGSSYIDGR